MKIIIPLKYHWDNKGQKYIYKYILFIVFGNFLFLIERTTSYNFPLVRYGIYSISLYFFIKGLRSTYNGFKFRSIFLRFIVFILILSIAYSIIISVPSWFSSFGNYVTLKRILGGHLLLFIIPLMLFMKLDLVLIKRVILLAYLMIIVFLILSVPMLLNITFYPNLTPEYFVRVFASGGTLILLTYYYHSKRVKMLIILTFILSLIFMLITARRNQILYLSSVILFSGAIIIFSKSKFVRRKKVSYIFGSLMMLVFLVLVYLLSNYNFTYLNQRIKEQNKYGIYYSRVNVIDNFYEDFNSTPLDWYFGRGINGDFLSRLGSTGSYYKGLNERGEIENGYLFLILKNGLLYLIPFIIISLVAAKKGFFNSSNLLSKAAAAIIIINLIDMIGFGVPSLSLKYIYVWMSLIICFSSTIRQFDDHYIKQIIGIK